LKTARARAGPVWNPSKRARSRRWHADQAQNKVDSGVRVVIAVFFLLTLAECASTERIDPRNPGDHCLYSCIDGMRCVGTIFRKANGPLYGQCELEPHRCATSADCVGGDICVRFGSDIGVCHPVTFP